MTPCSITPMLRVMVWSKRSAVLTLAAICQLPATRLCDPKELKELEQNAKILYILHV